MKLQPVKIKTNWTVTAAAALMTAILAVGATYVVKDQELKAARLAYIARLAELEGGFNTLGESIAAAREGQLQEESIEPAPRALATEPVELPPLAYLVYSDPVGFEFTYPNYLEFQESEDKSYLAIINDRSGRFQNGYVQIKEDRRPIPQKTESYRSEYENLGISVNSAGVTVGIYSNRVNFVDICGTAFGRSLYIVDFCFRIDAFKETDEYMEASVSIVEDIMKSFKFTI